ncbi:BTB/POZ domain-containing protein [Rhizophagus irregularis DAOM 181602=DAOM 197198]|nr:BTB/POZ domain-containing protein [Rhizophagus irregularis DAOM 181602=DAOM 197198]
MSHEYYQEVVNDLEKLFITEIGYDVIIYVGENENIKEFHAHSPILCTRLQYFCAAFSNKWAEKKDGKFIFKKPNIPPQIFNIILRFIYCGKIDLTKLQGLDALELLIAVDELNIQTLIPCIQKYLNEHKDEFLYQNPIEIFEMVYQYETIIWDSLIKWGLTQNPSIQQDFKKWDEEEINMMKKTLHRCIPLVRFHHMSQEDLHDKVFPLKTLLLKDVYNSLLTPNLKTNIIILPPRQSKSIYDSIIIDRKHFTTSRDGNTSKAFHEKCDNIESTIVIAKITNTEQIVGDKNDYQSVKLGYPDENEYLSSIYCNENYGPTFGGGHDLFCQNDGTWASYRAYSYPRMFPPLVTFDVEDYEVFQVIK